LTATTVPFHNPLYTWMTTEQQQQPQQRVSTTRSQSRHGMIALTATCNTNPSTTCRRHVSRHCRITPKEPMKTSRVNSLTSPAKVKEQRLFGPVQQQRGTQPWQRTGEHAAPCHMFPLPTAPGTVWCPPRCC
jgi:hypothetical protein